MKRAKLFSRPVVKRDTKEISVSKAQENFKNKIYWKKGENQAIRKIRSSPSHMILSLVCRQDWFRAIEIL